MRRLIGSALVGIAAILSFEFPAAGDPPEPKPQAAPIDPAVAKRAAEESKLVTEVGDRATAWVLARRELVPAKCWNCDGNGKIKSINASITGPAVVYVKCSTCEGTGRAISRTASEKVYGAFRSPARRCAEPGKPLPTNDPSGLALKSGKLGVIALIDETHAIVPILENGTDEMPWRWIKLTPKYTTVARWVLWEGEDSDGAWPEQSPSARGTDASPDAKSAPGQPPRLADLADPTKLISEQGSVGYTELRDWQRSYVHTIDADNTRAQAVLDRKLAKASGEELDLLDREVKLREANAALWIASCLDFQKSYYRATSVKRSSTGAKPEEPPVALSDSLTSAQEESVANALRAASFKHRVESLGRHAGVLVVRFRRLTGVAGVENEEASEAAAGPTAVAVALAVLPLLKEWESVSSEFVLPYRDSFGKIENHVHYIASLSRESFGKLTVGNLTVAEILTHFTIDRPALAGLVYWPR